MYQIAGKGRAGQAMTKAFLNNSNPGGRRRMFLLLDENSKASNSPFAWHHQIVSNGKHSRHAVRAKPGHVLVRFAIDNAFQRHVSVVHDNTDRAI